MTGFDPRRGCALLLAAVAGCADRAPPAAAPPPAPVTVARAQVKTVPVQLSAIGTVRVFATVAVRPRVDGELTAAHFREGEFVKKGDKLFTIDPRPYQTAFERAKAQLERDQALLHGAELNLNRAKLLAGTNAASGEELDRFHTEVDSARAAVAADQAAVRSADLQLGYTTIVSPIDGRTGNLLVTPGNLVAAAEATPLVVINQISPIAVSFAVPEQHLAAIESNRERRGGNLPVEARLRDGTPPLAGTLAFSDNAVDLATGTMQLKATFANQDRRLWPGQFVDVMLTLAERPASVTVPAAAVQDGQAGQFVFVVRPDNTAELRPVEVAFFTTSGEAVIAEGLTGAEVVITDGHLRVAPGGQVVAQSSAGGQAKP